MNKTTVISISDLWISAFLFACGITPTLEINNGKVLFVFPVSEDVDRLILNYQRGCTVKALDYAAAAKTLRGQMMNLKKSGSVNQ